MVGECVTTCYNLQPRLRAEQFLIFLVFLLAVVYSQHSAIMIVIMMLITPVVILNITMIYSHIVTFIDFFCYVSHSYYYPLVNKQFDPENKQFLMVSLVFQPRQLPGSNS